jgi:hypothetical protein
MDRVLTTEVIPELSPEINFEFKAEPSNFGYQVLAFKNDSFDIIIRNNDKRNSKKYLITVVEI